MKWAPLELRRLIKQSGLVWELMTLGEEVGERIDSAEVLRLVEESKRPTFFHGRGELKIRLSETKWIIGGRLAC